MDGKWQKSTMKREEMKKRTVLYGGSFNPIHLGHLALGQYLLETQPVDEVWYMISPQNPLKQADGLLPDADRLELVRKAVEGCAGLAACDFEFRLPRPSYTVHTLEAIRRAFPDREFSLLIGADNWAHFPRWHQFRKILDENEIFVYPRTGYPLHTEDLPPQVHVLDAPLFDASSTDIREAIAGGNPESVAGLLPPAVYREILRRGFYR